MSGVTLSTGQWTPIGPAPIHTQGGLGDISGRVQAPAPDPTDPTTIYIGADNGGIWKTTTSPPNWTPLTDQMPSLNVTGYHSLVVHPANHNLVLGPVSGPGAGIMKSVDGGNSWQLLANNQFDGQFLTSLAVHPTDQNTMYLSASWFGAWKSTDGGVTWQQLTSLPAGSVWDLILAKFDSNTLYAAVVGNAGAQQAQNGVYKSTDSGTTWTPLSGLPSSAALGGSNISGAVRIESGTAQGVVYVSMLTLGMNPSPPPPLAVTAIQRFWTNDGGATWTPLTPSPGTLENRWWHLVLGVDPGNEKHVFVNDAYGLFESWDAGNTWSQADANIGYLKSINHFDFVNLIFDANGKAVVTVDQGVLQYDPSTQSWTSLMGNLQVSEFYTIGLDPSTASVAYGVGQDIFSEKFTGQTDWNVMEGGIGETGKIIVDHTNSNQLFGFNPLDANNFVMQSPNAGATWTNVFPAALLNSSFLTIYNQSKGYGFAYLSQKAFAMDPSNSARLLVIADRVYETTNSGGTWLQISGVLSQDSSNPFVAAIAIAPSDSNTLYASTQDGRLWVTHNDGTQWTESDSGLSGIVVDLRIDPVVPNHVFAITPRHNNTSAAVWHLPSSGLPWVNITGSIPNNLNFYSIFVDWEPATPTLFVGTDRGLYLSLDLGASWTKLGLGLPNTRINDIQGEIVGGKMVLAVATFGRGAWEILFRCLRPAESWAVSWGPGRLDVFGAGENNELLQRSWTTPGPPPAPLGGTLGMIYPSAVSWDTGRLDVFGVGENRDLLWWSSFNGIWAPGPVSLGGTLGSLFPSAVSWGPGRLDVFGVGLNNELLHWWFDAGTWTGHTESLDSGMWTNSKPTVVSWGPRRLDVFGVGFNHELLHRWYDGTTWWPPGGPESVTALVGGTLLFSTSQSAVSSNAGQLDVFGVGENNELLYWSFNGTWRAPVSFDSGMWTCSKPSVVSWCSGRLDVFGEGENNVLLHRWFDGTGWNGPESLGGTLLTGAAPAAVSSNAGQLEVFGLGQNHDLLYWSFNGTWTGPVSLDPGIWRSDVD